MTGEKKGYCLECKKTFKGDEMDFLCPSCLETEIKGLENGNPTDYLYAAMIFENRKAMMKKANESLLIVRPRWTGKNKMMIDAVLNWLDENAKEVKKITFEFF